MMTGLVYTYGDAENAMCLWEAFLDLWNEEGTGNPITQKLRDYTEGVGFAEARTHVLDAVRRCDEEFRAIQEDFTGSFDWDYCPAFIHRLVEEGYFD
jgi:hypothetical protein